MLKFRGLREKWGHGGQRDKELGRLCRALTSGMRVLGSYRPNLLAETTILLLCGGHVRGGQQWQQGSCRKPGKERETFRLGEGNLLRKTLK